MGLPPPTITVADVRQMLSDLPETEERLTWDSATIPSKEQNILHDPS